MAKEPLPLHSLLWGALLLGGLLAARLHSFLLFQAFAELLSVGVALGIFAVAWNARAFLDTHYLLLLSIAYAFVGGLDTLHTLAYPGMGVFPGPGTNLATQLWIGARLLESVSLLAAPLFVTRRLRAGPTAAGYAVAVALLLASIFYWGVFPTCFVEGTGLTPFKIGAEYVVCGMLLAAAGFLWRSHARFPAGVTRLLLASIVATVASELAFTLYASPYGASLVVGHLFKITSFAFIYLAVVETGIRRPYALAFGELRDEAGTLARASELKSLVLDSMTERVIYFDRDRKVVWANRAARSTAGVSADEAVGRTCHDLKWSSPEPCPGCPVPEVFETGEPREKEIVFPDGQARLVRAYPVRDGSGVLTGGVTFSLDITQRRKTREELRRNRERLILAVEAGRLGVYEHQIPMSDGYYASPRWAELYGYTVDDLPGADESLDWWTDRIHPDDRPRVKEKFLELCSGWSETYEVEYRARHRSGEWRHLLALANAADRDADGQVTRVVGVTLDITDRVQAEKSLSLYTKRLLALRDLDRAILEPSADTGQIAAIALERLQDLVGYARASVFLVEPGADRVQVLGMVRNGARVPEEREWLPQEELRPLDPLRSGQPRTIEDLATAPDLSPNDQQMLAEGLRSYTQIPLFPGGRLSGCLNVAWNHPGGASEESLEIAREVADVLALAIENARLHEAEQEKRAQLRAVTTRLEEMETAERKHLARELHDRVGQNLTALGLNLKIAADRVSDDEANAVLPRLEDCMDLVDEVGRHVRDVMGELRPTVLDEYGLRPALRWLCEKFSARTGLLFRVQGWEHEPRLPPDRETTLSRVAQEALTNAAKHAGPGLVTIELQETEGLCRMVVTDTGTGFDPEGLGDTDVWGLAIMRERMAGVGGSLRVHSAPGEGTRVVAEVGR